MKMKFIFALSATAFAVPALASEVGVSVSIGQPGFYGRLDIGDYPQPRVIYRQPRIIESVPATRPPIYLRVRPGQAKHWSKYCREYNACEERVFFVQDDWYNREYAPRYQKRHHDKYEQRLAEGLKAHRDDRDDERHNNGAGR